MTIKVMTRIQCSFFSFAKLTPTRFNRINGWCGTVLLSCYNGFIYELESYLLFLIPSF